MSFRTRLTIGFLGIAILAGLASAVGLSYVHAAADEVVGVADERGAQLVALAQASGSLLEFAGAVDRWRNRDAQAYAASPIRDEQGLAPDAARALTQARAAVDRLLGWLARYRDVADEPIERHDGQQMVELAEGLREIASAMGRLGMVDSTRHQEAAALHHQLLPMIHDAVEDESAELEAARLRAVSYRDAASAWGSLIVALAIVVASALGLMLARSIATPAAALRSAAQRLAEGDLEARVVVRGAPEFVQVAAAFNRMAEAVQKASAALNEKVTELNAVNALLENEMEKRRLASAAYRRSEERFHTVTGTANDAILCTDDRGRIIFANHAAQKLFGYPAAELIHEPISRVLALTLDNLVQKSLEVQRDSASPGVFPSTGIDREGNTLSLNLSLADWRTDLGHFFAVIAHRLDHRPAEPDDPRDPSR